MSRTYRNTDARKRPNHKSMTPYNRKGYKRDMFVA